nr:hypothetical protein [Rhodococcus sp. (in: high G+C Gram-positive bacteria)]
MRLDIDPWVHTAEWLVESLFDQPVALIIDLGPSDYIRSDDEEDDDDDEVVCAQIQVMADRVFLLRRSRSELGHLLLADYSTAGVTLDKWYNNDQFDDCTDGYIFSRDARLIADTCVTWFRDNWGARSTDELGCDYRFPDVLLPEDPTLF